MIEIKFVGTGGQGVVVASKLLNIAASKSGHQIQSFASFGYSRRGGTVESYVRISEEKIHIHTKMYEPDYLVLMGEEYAKDRNIVSGLKEGGSILINSPQPPEHFSSLGNFKIVTVDADRIAFDAGLRLPSGLPIINSAILGAILGMIPFVGIDTLSEAIVEGGIPLPEKNLEAAKEAYERVTSPQEAAVAVVAEEEATKISEGRLPAYRTTIPPCVANCPAGEAIHKTASLIRENRFEEALECIKTENPFPGICGRVCFHPCETQCNRNEFDEGVAANALERAAFDYADSNGQRKPTKKAKTGKEVAVIGSGPAGMTCAYFLAILGHDVTVFEALSVPGGIPRVGIPEYRLPRSVVDKETSEIIDLGIKVRTNTEVGKDISLENIVEKYDACFIGTGAHRSINLDIPGEGSYGVISGLDFLKDVAFEKEVDVGPRVAVIGGGNTAVDAARTARRLGAKDVTVIYRRSFEEIPAYRAEVEAAEKEGIRISYLAMPVQIHGNAKRVRRVECVKTKLGKEGKDGRRRPVPVEGSNFMVDVDTVIAALGESVGLPFSTSTIEMDEGLIKVDHLGRTSVPGIYAGGDLTTSNRSVVESIASGKRAALGIDIRLRDSDERNAALFREGERGAVSMRRYIAEDYRENALGVVSFSDLNTNYFSRSRRVRVSELPAGRGSPDFNELNLGLAKDQAIAEAGRCFQCGHCDLCGNCYSFCPDVAILFDAEAFSFKVDEQLCKRCGICIEECPRYAIAWKGVV